MPFNLLLFPLVGGYYIIANSEWYRYRTQRLHSERLIFNSVIAGCILLSCCFIMKWIALAVMQDFVVLLYDLLPVKNQDYFGVTIFSFLIGIAVTEISNLKIDETKQIKKAINKIGNDLEKLLLFSADQRELIQITLKNDKVYVGMCSRIPVPDKTSYINIIPFFSGFRNSADKTLTFNTDYTGVYSDYIKQGLILSIEDLNASVIINTDEILTASRFDYDMYERFSIQNAPVANN